MFLGTTPLIGRRFENRRRLAWLEMDCQFMRYMDRACNIASDEFTGAAFAKAGVQFVLVL